MGRYDTQQVCLNGHQITDNYYSSPEFRKNFCTKCGEKTIYQCPNCGSDIRGDYHADGVVAIGFKTPVPTHCEKCGKPFPWFKNNDKSNDKTTKSQNTFNNLNTLEKLFSQFHKVVKSLRRRHSNRNSLDVNDEYDVQDLTRSILYIFFEDIREEEWTPSYAGKSSRLDFLLKKEQIVVEAKMTRQNLTDKEIGDQLLIDIARYEAHQDCKTLVCFVYDPEGRIVNPKGLIQDLQKKSKKEMQVVVFINPS
jgi:hypothetical protein